MFKTEQIDYFEGETLLGGFCVYDDKHKQKRPGILICHDWSGQNDFAKQKAHELAELGYVAFAVDMFGKGKIGTTTEEKSALIQPLMHNRSLLQKRILAAFNTIKKIEAVDTTKIGAIGFCFGGLCVLDLARGGADIKGVVSFHGLLNQPESLKKESIKASILALHGFDDPMVTPDQVTAFGEEMTHANADWQLTMYGHTKHAFTNPNAHDTNLGLIYNKRTSDRAWAAMKLFFQEIL